MLTVMEAPQPRRRSVKLFHVAVRLSIIDLTICFSTRGGSRRT